MTDQRDDIYDGPPLAGEDALEGADDEATWIGRLREQFLGYDLDWNELEAFSGDRGALAERIANATALDQTEVSRRIGVAGAIQHPDNEGDIDDR
jgi:hypothetical protein